MSNPSPRFDIELAAEVVKVSLRLKKLDGVEIRRCRMAFARPFDDEIAAALGDDAKKALASLKSGGMSKVVMDIEGIDAQAVLANGGGDNVTVDIIRGEKAICTGPKDPEDPPSIRLEFDTHYHDDIWAWLGRNCGGVARIEFKNRQTEIPGLAGVTPIRPGQPGAH